jgi:hypothetical protein
MSRSRRPYSPEQARRFGETTIAYYDRFAQEFWHGARDHDVCQNHTALGALRAGYRPVLHPSIDAIQTATADA